MKLYERDLVNCVLLCEVWEDDGEGGVDAYISEEAEFKAALIERKLKIYEKGGKSWAYGEYDAVVPSEFDVVLEIGDRFRSEDGTVYTVIGEGMTPPDFSVIRFTQYRAAAIMEEVKA